MCDTNNTRYTGCVKWFNKKAGYGFVTIVGSEKNNIDIFVHHSSIDVHIEQYKYLVQGEYIEFDLTQTTDEKYEYFASNITGINGGKLMCETRYDNQQQSTNPQRQHNYKKIHKVRREKYPPIVENRSRM